MQYPIIDTFAEAYINNGWTGADITTGKNLYNEANYPMTEDHAIIGATGAFVESSISACATENYINIHDIIGETVTLNHCSGGQTVGFSFYNADNVFITGIPNNNVPGVGEPWTINIPNDSSIVYMRFTSNNNYIGQIQIELGDTATSYEPYEVKATDIVHRLKLPLPHYFPHPVIDALQAAAAGTQTAEQTEILQHYLTPLGIGGI